MTTLENSLYVPPVMVAEYTPPTPIQHVYGESDSPTEPPRLYSSRWRNMRTSGGMGDPTMGRTWSRKYGFVSLPIHKDFVKTQQANHKNDVLNHPGTAIRQTRQQRYVDMARGRAHHASRYASKSDRGTNYNTRNFIHVDSDGVLLNNIDAPGLGIGPEAGLFPPVVAIAPLISADMTDPFPQQETTHPGVLMPSPMPVAQPETPAYGTTTKSSILLATPATNPDVVDAVTQRYVFKLTAENSIATRDNDDKTQQLIMESIEMGHQLDKKTNLFIDENMEYYVLREDTGRPTWDEPNWVRHYLSPEQAMGYFGRERGDPIIPGIDLTVSKWAEASDGYKFISLVGTRQYYYGNTRTSSNFHVTYTS
jgi:hypothetical protein